MKRFDAELGDLSKPTNRDQIAHCRLLSVPLYSRTRGSSQAENGKNLFRFEGKNPPARYTGQILSRPRHPARGCDKGHSRSSASNFRKANGYAKSCYHGRCNNDTSYAVAS